MCLRLSLKDLGVAQGLGKEAREGAARRHATLQQRTEAIGMLPVSAAKAERLVAISGIPAGLYGVAARPPDADTLACMRRWVMHACYKGSRFVQSSLWFVLCSASWRSDPVKVWMIKAADACARQARTHGLELVQRVWDARGKLGPVAGLHRPAAGAGERLESRALVCGRVLQAAQVGQHPHGRVGGGRWKGPCQGRRSTTRFNGGAG